MISSLRSLKIFLFLFWVLLINDCSTSDHSGEAKDTMKNAAHQEELSEWRSPLRKLETQYRLKPDELVLIVEVTQQKLYVVKE